MITAPTYAAAILWAVCVPVVFAIVSDRCGMNRQDRLAVLRVLWCLPLALSLLALMCGVLILITP